MNSQQAFHQRFKRVLLGIGVLGLLLILFFSVRYADHQRQTMYDTILADSLLLERWFVNMDATDSLQLQSLAGKHLVVAFWATWSPRSMEIVDSLINKRAQLGDALVIVAANVKDNGSEAREYMARHTDQVIFVDGTLHYLDLRIVGVPSAIAFDPSLQDDSSKANLHPTPIKGKPFKPVVIATGEEQMRKLLTTWPAADKSP